MRSLLVGIAVLVIGAGPGLTEDIVLVNRARARCTIVLPSEPDENEKLAASEITSYVGKMSGAQVPIRTEGTLHSRLPLHIGTTAENKPLIAQLPPDSQGFVIVARPDRINLVGATSIGTLYAAYDFLERLGCRWFMPGKTGEIVPHKPTVIIPPLEVVQEPDFVGRYLEGEATWAKRNRLGGKYFPTAHSWNRHVPPKKYFDKHPEYFALVNGKRQPTQLCTSNPDVIKLVAEVIKDNIRANPENPWVGIGPNDGGGFCECENCRALDTGDWDPYSGEISITDRFLAFANAIAALVHEESPQAKFAYYIYHTYMRPPLKVKPDPSISGALAPITLCRVHGLGNPLCPERVYWSKLIKQWPQVMKEVYHRGYAYNLAGPQVPLSLVSVWREEVPACKQAGLVGFRVEGAICWASHMPTPYIMAKLFWDADADVDALLDDYFSKFFGPAAGPMYHYWKILDEALYNADFHTGNAWNVPDWYPPKVMERLSAHISEATRVANSEPYRERVRLFARAFEYLQAFQRLLASQQRFDFVTAAKAYNDMQAIVDEFMAYDPPLFNKYGAPRFLPRFWKEAIYQGKERTTGGNELAMALPDEWEFLLDPAKVGKGQQWYEPNLKGGNWQKLKTYSASWSDQGLRYYKGKAWYRQTVTVPARFQGRQLFLWFGEVDEKAEVWVNGRLVGEDGPGPFEFEVTDFVDCGRPTIIAVEVTNEVVDELGTGGITKPVMIWAGSVQ